MQDGGEVATEKIKRRRKKKRVPRSRLQRYDGGVRAWECLSGLFTYLTRLFVERVIRKDHLQRRIGGRGEHGGREDHQRETRFCEQAQDLPPRVQLKYTVK